MTNSIKGWWLGTTTAECLGAKASRAHLLAQIEARFGKEVADETDLEKDVMTFGRWHFAGYRIKPMEESLIGIKLLPTKSEGTAMTIYKPTPVRLFHRYQVRKVRFTN